MLTPEMTRKCYFGNKPRIDNIKEEDLLSTFHTRYGINVIGHVFKL